MRLYQHSAQCPAALQIFLDANPQYWAFIPMKAEEAERPEQCFAHVPNIAEQSINSMRRSKGECQQYVDSLPKPPEGFVFSQRQIMKQMEYFHQLQDKKQPNAEVDLYDATIIAVCKYILLLSLILYNVIL